MNSFGERASSPRFGSGAPLCVDEPHRCCGSPGRCCGLVLAMVWLRLSTRCSLSFPIPSPAGPSTGLYCWHRTCKRLKKKMAEKERKKNQTPNTKQPSFLAVPPLLLYSSEVQVLK